MEIWLLGRAWMQLCYENDWTSISSKRDFWSHFKTIHRHHSVEYSAIFFGLINYASSHKLIAIVIIPQWRWYILCIHMKHVSEENGVCGMHEYLSRAPDPNAPLAIGFFFSSDFFSSGFFLFIFFHFHSWGSLDGKPRQCIYIFICFILYIEYWGVSPTLIISNSTDKFRCRFSCRLIFHILIYRKLIFSFGYFFCPLLFCFVFFLNRERETHYTVFFFAPPDLTTMTLG